MGTSTLHLDNQGTDPSVRNQSFVARAEENKKITASRKSSELKSLSLLAALSDPSGKNPPSSLEKISSALQSGKKLSEALSDLPEQELAELRAKVGADILPQLL